MNDSDNLPVPPAFQVQRCTNALARKHPSWDQARIRQCAHHVWKHLHHIGRYTTSQIDQQVEFKYKRLQLDPSALLQNPRPKTRAKPKKSKSEQKTIYTERQKQILDHPNFLDRLRQYSPITKTLTDAICALLIKSELDYKTLSIDDVVDKLLTTMDVYHQRKHQPGYRPKSHWDTASQDQVWDEFKRISQSYSYTSIASCMDNKISHHTIGSWARGDTAKPVRHLWPRIRRFVIGYHMDSFKNLLQEKGHRVKAKRYVIKLARQRV